MKLFHRTLFTFIALLVAVGANAQDNQQLRDSLRAATDALAYHPDSIDLRLRKASWNMQLEQYDYAREEYDYVLRRDPRNVSALLFRAYCNERTGRLGFARQDYEVLLSIVPSNEQGMLGLAMLSHRQKRYQEALDLMGILIERNPRSDVGYCIRSGMEQDRGMMELAEYDISRAIDLNGTERDYLLRRVEIRLAMKKWSGAKADLDRLVGLGESPAALAHYYRRVKRKK